MARHLHDPSPQHHSRRSRWRGGIAAAAALGLVLAGTLALGTQAAVADVAPGSTAYVAEDGSDAGNDCASAAAPCATVTHALTRVARGATIRISGTVHDNVVVPTGITPLTLSGAGAASPAVLDGSGADTVVQHLGPLRIEHLEIRNGDAIHGGGISAWGALVLADSTVTGNVAYDYGGGIYIHSNASARILDSSITDNHSVRSVAVGGGGIYSSDAPLTVLRSTISGNRAGGSGGGIRFASYKKTFLMADSTVSGNSAGNRGGGLSGGNMLIRNTTITGNRATYGGGIDNTSLADNPMRLLSSTVARNTDAAYGGAIYGSEWNAQIGGSLFEGNSVPQCDGSLSASSVGHNLSSDGSCTGHATDRPALDPRLGPLADHQGATRTMMPAADGPAADAIPVGTVLAGVQLCARDDQRGVAGPVPGATGCAVGAVEPASWSLEAQPPITVTGSGNVVDGVTLGTSGGAGGGEVSFTVAPGTAPGCRIDGMVEPFVLRADATGTCLVAATRTAAGRYAAASSAPAPVELPRARQYIVHMNGGIEGRLDAALRLAASGGAGTGAYTFATVPGGTATGCTVSDTAPWTITATSRGTCLVVATREGDSRYEAETSTPQPVTFTRIPQADLVISSPLEATIGEPLVLATTGGSGDGEISWWPTRGSVGCTVTGSEPYRLTASAAGWCSVYAIKAADERYHSKVSPVVHIAWDKGTQVPLVLTSTTGRFGTPLTLAWTGGSGTGNLAISAEDGTATGCASSGSWPGPYLLTSTAPGTCLVTISREGDTGYLPASTGPVTVTLTKEPQASLRVTGSLSAAAWTAVPLGSEGGSGSGFVSFAAADGTADGCTVDGTLLTATTAGTCLVTATKEGDALHEPVSSSPTVVTFEKVAQAPLVVTSTRGTQGTPLPLVSEGGSGTGPLAWTAADGTATGCRVDPEAPFRLRAESPGTCRVVVTKAADRNHHAASSAATLVTLDAPPVAPVPAPSPSPTPSPTPAPAPEPAPGPVVGTPGKVSRVKVAGRPAAGRRKVTWRAPAGTGPVTYQVVVSRGKAKVLTRTVTRTRLVLKRSELRKGRLKVTVTPLAAGTSGRSTSTGFRVR